MFSELFIKYLHLTCLIGISLHIQIYPAKYNHISPNGADFLLGLLLIQFLRVICAVSCHKNGSLATALTWLDKNRRKHNPEERSFSPCFTRLRKKPSTNCDFWGQKCGCFQQYLRNIQKAAFLYGKRSNHTGRLLIIAGRVLIAECGIVLSSKQNARSRHRNRAF